MITLENFYDLLDQNAKVTLVNAKYHKNVYSGSAHSIPLEYSICPVEDFSMNDSGHLTFKINVRDPKPAGNGWQDGALPVGSGIYHYWVKQYETGSEYGIDEGRVSKMMMTRKGETVCNYDRGWDVKPVDDETETAMEILLHQYN